jgi:hypothetical protein
MSVSDINTKCAAAAAAVEAGDYETALLKLRAARMLMAGLPDSQGADSGLRWDRTSIDKMITDLTQQKTNSSTRTSGIRTTNITYKNPRSDSDCD